jgi:hypothetical protein
LCHAFSLKCVHFSTSPHAGFNQSSRLAFINATAAAMQISSSNLTVQYVNYDSGNGGIQVTALATIPLTGPYAQFAGNPMGLYNSLYSNIYTAYTSGRYSRLIQSAAHVYGSQDLLLATVVNYYQSMYTQYPQYPSSSGGSSYEHKPFELLCYGNGRYGGVPTAWNWTLDYSNIMVNGDQVASVSGALQYDVPWGGKSGSISALGRDTLNSQLQYSGK